MSTFQIIFEEFCKNIIREGGNAFNNVSRIKREYINDVVDLFKHTVIEKLLNADPKDSLFLLGSTGKKTDSGDIDIGLDANILHDNILVSLMKLDELCAKNNIKSYINTISFDMLHVCFQQPNNKFVQIDLLLTEYPEFTKFFMFSPAENESRYKGAHRNTLLKSILLAATLSNVIYDNKHQPIKWNQYDLTSNGMIQCAKTLVDENGNRLMYKTTNEPLEIEYAKNEYIHYLSHDVDTIIKFIVGDFKQEDIDTFEKLFNIVVHNDSFKHKDKRDTILKICAKKLKEAEKRLIFPDELKIFI